VIETLRIENLAILERAEIEFGPGLNVLTGETGAGKSIVLGALALLAGGRASADSLREGADEGSVEAVFRTEGLPQLEAELAERGLEVDDHELVLRRTVSRAGRSRAQISGKLVPLSLLNELFAGRIEISSQHDSQQLRRAETHGELLDRSGGLLDRRQAVASGVAELRALDAELEGLRSAAQERERRRDFLSFQVAEIDEARLDPDEVEGLRGQRARLAHAEQLREGASAALACLAGDPVRPEDAGAGDLAGEAARRVADLAEIDPDLAGQAERVAALVSEIRDAAAELERYADGIESDPAQLAAADERLQRVEQLQRKYGADVDAILRFRDEAAAELSGIAGADERTEAIDRERQRVRSRLVEEARKLTRGRSRAAKSLSQTVEASLQELAMPQARFAVALEPAERPDAAPCGSSGNERPEFAFTANAGEPLRPLRKVASGGELSRAFLAVKNALREGGAGMVLVFDEVDAGISGAAADRVGRVLADLAAHHQILCITHLPQIAAFAGTHFRVEKRAHKGRSSARIQLVEGADRVEEIARMAGGVEVADATREHARELLNSRTTP
jgi:DNA repair protein RecN (Recombination protein N)